MNDKPDKKQRLDNPVRLKEYGISDILAQMKPIEDLTGADIGCGTGLFTIPLAREIANGKMYAVDINGEYLNLLNEKIKSEGISNVETVNAKDAGKRIKNNSLDFLFICVVLHEIDDKNAFLQFYRSKLRDGGRIFIIDFTSSKRSLSDNGESNKIFIPSDVAERIIAESGYKNVSSKVLNELVYILSAEK